MPPSGRITLVFTDIADSSRMTRALGDGVYLRTMREPHCQRIRAAIAGHEGFEVKTVGDCFMIAFAAADRALACALAIQKALAQPPITAADQHGTLWKVQVRIGVHTSERELVPHEENGRFDYTGSDVNFAARVESLGGGGQIIVSDSTYRAAGSREMYGWQQWADRRIKSFDQPETVWELLWDGQTRGEPGARWLPAWFMGERNRYIARPALQDTVLQTFAAARPDGSTPRLVTLHAEGGMGKTRLALACAIQAAGMFPDGVFFIRLDDRPKNKHALAEAIGAALGRIGEAALPDRLLADVRDLQMLLVLDNYESVDCDEVTEYTAALLLRTRGLHLLVTGREGVKLSDAEQLISLDDGMTDLEAEQLFIARAGLKNRDWQPAAGERGDLRRIVRLAGRIPLALELAAAWIDKRTLAEIAAGMEATPLGQYVGEPPRSHRTDNVVRHRSLRRCLDWSMHLLEDWAREGFARLGMFAHSFGAETAREACGVANAQLVLDRLQDAALVRRLEVGGRSRYTLHRFTRAYAAEKLLSLPDAQEVRRRFVAYYRDLARENDDINSLAKLAVLEGEWRNAIGAAEVAEQLADFATVQRISECLGDFMDCRELWSEWQGLNERALKAAQASGECQAEGRALNNLGNVYHSQGRVQEAETAYQQSLAIFRELGERLDEGKALNNLGIVCYNQGRWKDAEAAYQQSLAIFREFGERLAEGQALQNLGSLYHSKLRWQEAKSAYQQSLAIRREFSDRLGEGQTLNNLGVLHGEWGRLKEAETAYQQSLAIFREIGGRVGEGQALANLALLRKAQGDLQAACEFAKTALAVFETTQDEAAKLEARQLLADWLAQGSERRS